MSETLAKKFALVGLDGLDSIHGSVSKKAVIKGIKAAVLLESMLEENGQDAGDRVAEEFQEKLRAVKKCSKKQMDTLEKEMFAQLAADGSMTEVQDLMACDLYYDSAGLAMRQYRCRPELYLKITEEIRAEILEEGPVTSECFYLLWLFRETGILHDLFSVNEQSQVNIRLTEAVSRDPFYRMIYSQEFHSGINAMSVTFLKLKSILFTNPYLEGVNLLFPFLERRKAIFIDMVVFHTTVRERREYTAEYLRERGHLVEEVRNGEEYLLKIDNNLYRVFPTTRMSQLPIQGISLTPYYR